MSLKQDPILNSVFLFLAEVEMAIDRAKALSRSGRHRECRLSLAGIQEKIHKFSPGERAHTHQTGSLPAGDKE